MSATSLDQLPRMLVSFLLYGHQLLFPIPDVDRTDFLLVIGANPVVSNGSLLTAPGLSKRLAAIRARGGQVVVVDPRRTETAEIASRHLFVRPGTDALLLAALVHVVFEEGLARPALAARLDGLEDVRAFAKAWPPERVAAAVGIEAGEIRALARDFARARTAACYGRIGTCTQELGTVATWLTEVLNVITGNLDREGGMLFPDPAVDLVAGAARVGQSGSFGRWKSRVRGLPEFGGEVPVAGFADEIETDGPGRIRGLLLHAGNPVLSSPNGVRLDAALAKLEHVVAIDIYLNETTRHAHVILPPTAPLERDHFDLAFGLLSARNVAKYVPPLLAPPPDSRHDWQIFLELGRRLARAESGLRSLGWRAAWSALGKLGPRGVLDLMLRAGPYGRRFLVGEGLDLAKVERAPHGIDLGPLRPTLERRLGGRRIDLLPRAIRDDLARLDERLAREASRAKDSLVLIGRRQLRGNNSWMHNLPRLVDRGGDACTLLMHPDDATARGLRTGDRVRVASTKGAVVVPLEATDEVRRGVVSLPHGWGHGRSGTRMTVANGRPGASLNDLTDERFLDSLSGTASLSGTPVTVAAESRETA
jgi:anaerobic selenocysteine-containing dehydrogenase